jgi:hypothetical protein
MNAASVDSIAPENETKVWPGTVAALDVVGMESRLEIGEGAEQDAERLLRATFRLGAPVDPVGIARELSIEVLEAEYEPDVLGGLLVKPGEESKIFLNQRDGVIRRRLTCAFELAHYVRGSEEKEAYGRVDRRGDDSSADPELIYADAFAASLLMPALEVELLSELGIGVLELALRFQVPREVVWSRLEDLGLRVADRSVA